MRDKIKDFGSKKRLFGTFQKAKIAIFRGFLVILHYKNEKND